MPDPLPRFILGPLNLQIKHWATLLKVLLLTDLCVLYDLCNVRSRSISPARVNRAASGSCCFVVY